MITAHHKDPQRESQTITESIRKIIDAIDKADVAAGEKEKTKRMLAQLLKSKAAIAVLNPFVHNMSGGGHER